MRMIRIKKLLCTIALGGWLLTTPNCLPSHSQLNSTFNSGILSGIQFALTIGVTNILNALTPNISTTTTDTTATTDNTTATTG